MKLARNYCKIQTQKQKPKRSILLGACTSKEIFLRRGPKEGSRYEGGSLKLDQEGKERAKTSFPKEGREETPTRRKRERIPSQEG